MERTIQRGRKDKEGVLVDDYSVSLASVPSDGRENIFLDVRVFDRVDEKVRDGLEVGTGRQITVLFGGCPITEGSFEENGIEVRVHGQEIVRVEIRSLLLYWPCAVLALGDY
jgi:hypothetical protein